MPVKNEKNKAIIPSHAVHIGRWKKYLAVGIWQPLLLSGKGAYLIVLAAYWWLSGWPIIIFRWTCCKLLELDWILPATLGAIAYTISAITIRQHQGRRSVGKWLSQSSEHKDMQYNQYGTYMPYKCMVNTTDCFTFSTLRIKYTVIFIFMDFRIIFIISYMIAD